MTTLVILGCIVLGAALLLLYLHQRFTAPRHDDCANPSDYGLRYQALRIPSVSSAQLSIWWIRHEHAIANVVLLHGWGSGKAHLLPLAQTLHALGLTIVMLDARNHGDSDRQTFSSMPRFAEDLRQAISWLQGTQGQSLPLLLAGHSVGAGAVLLEASRRTDLAGILAFSAFAHPREVMLKYLQALPVPRGLFPAILAYVQWLIGHRFDDIAPVNTIRHSRCPVLIVHGMQDQTVPINDARRLAAAAGARGTVVWLDDADHDLRQALDAGAIRTLTTFIDHCLKTG